MKSLPRLLSTARPALAAVLVASLGPALHAADPADASAKAGAKAADHAASRIEDFRADRSDLSKAEVKAALDSIDAELDHLERLADAAPTPAQKDAIKARHDELEARRDDLKSQFTSAKYQAFKADLKAEVDKASAWARDTFSNQPAASRAASDVASSADRAAEKIADYRNESSDLRKAEVKAALARLDVDIDLLAAKIDTVADADRKAELKARLENYRKRRAELNGEFRSARFDALASDVKAEWNRLTQ
jgi:hypothetical protein